MISKYTDYYVDIKNNIELYKNIINILFNLYQYIDFTTFYERIETLVNSFLDKVLKNDYSKIIFITYNGINKSNTWCFLLFMSKLFASERYNKFLEKYRAKYYFAYTINDVSHYFNEGDNIICFHFDDMTYSGTQLSDDSSFNINILDNLKITNTINNYEYYYIVSYYTKKALDYLKNKNIYYKNKENIKILDDENNTGIIHSISENIKDNEIFKSLDENMKKEILLILGCETNIKINKILDFIYKPIINYLRLYDDNKQILPKPAVYFQHKLADSISTYTQFIYKGIEMGYHNNFKSCQSYPLIKNCIYNQFYDTLKDIKGEYNKKKNKYNEKYKYNKNICFMQENNASVLETLSNEYGCPITYYKQDMVKYIYKGEEINKTLINLFNQIILIKNRKKTETEKRYGGSNKRKNQKTKKHKNKAKNKSKKYRENKY